MRLGPKNVEAEKVHLQRLPGFLSLQGSHLDVLNITWTHIFQKEQKNYFELFFLDLNENLNGYIFYGMWYGNYKSE